MLVVGPTPSEVGSTMARSNLLVRSSEVESSLVLEGSKLEQGCIFSEVVGSTLLLGLDLMGGEIDPDLEEFEEDLVEFWCCCCYFQ